MKLLLVAALMTPAGLPELSPSDMEVCEREGGCLVMTRDTLRRLMDNAGKESLYQCRNYLKGEAI
jgi:hypothetical protein